MDHDRDRNRGEPLMRADLPSCPCLLFASVIVGRVAKPSGNKSIQEPIPLRSAVTPNRFRARFYQNSIKDPGLSFSLFISQFHFPRILTFYFSPPSSLLRIWLIFYTLACAS